MITATAMKPRKITITGREAQCIAQHVRTYVLRHGKGWHEVQGMNECGHGCKLYARQRGCVVEYQLWHSATYGCALGRDASTRTVPVSVLMAAV